MPLLFSDQCVHFERRPDFYNGQLAFTFFDAAAGVSLRVICDEVLGGWNGKAEGYYYRVGYCPAAIEGDFIKATTLFFLAISPTPEYGLIDWGLPLEEKGRLRRTGRKLDMQRFRDTEDFPRSSGSTTTVFRKVITFGKGRSRPPL